MASREDKVQKAKKEIGAHIRAVRTMRNETGPEVAARAGTDKGLISYLEQGKANPTLDVFLPIILDGLKMEWPEFCARFAEEEAERQAEQREARRLFENLMLQGRASRRGVIAALKLIGGDGESGRGRE